MGVAHIHDIKYEKDTNGLQSLCGGQVDLYVDTFKTLNVKIWTHHSVLMGKLGMWERFKKFKQRVVDKHGKPVQNVDITKEKEIWFGFTRRFPGPRDRKDKMFEWCSISCTLNTWIWDNYFTDSFNFLSGASWRRDAAPKVVTKAGLKGSDNQAATANLINIIPPRLWDLIRHELCKLTPGDRTNFPCWNHKRISDKDGDAKAMKSLVLKAAKGSMIYEVDISFRGLGLRKNGFELFCEVLIGLMEEEKMKKEDQFQLRILKLYYNNLNDIHLETLFKLVKMCPKLERLWLCGNQLTRKGCWKVVRRCRDYKMEILLFGNEGWSIGLHKYQKKLAYAPWMRESYETLWHINNFGLILMQYPSYAFNEALILPDIKELFGFPSLMDAKYLYDYFCPVDRNLSSELFQIWNVEKAVRPGVVKLMLEVRRQSEQHIDKFMAQLLSNPELSSTLKRLSFESYNDRVYNLGNPDVLKSILREDGGVQTLKEWVSSVDVNAANIIGNIFSKSSNLDNDELKIDNDELKID